jgi:hypothetical protein
VLFGWLTKKKKRKRDIYILEEKKKKRNAVAMSNIQLICVGNDDG